MSFRLLGGAIVAPYLAFIARMVEGGLALHRFKVLRPCAIERASCAEARAVTAWQGSVGRLAGRRVFAAATAFACLAAADIRTAGQADREILSILAF